LLDQGVAPVAPDLGLDGALHFPDSGLDTGAVVGIELQRRNRPIQRAESSLSIFQLALQLIEAGDFDVHWRLQISSLKVLISRAGKAILLWYVEGND
jgi:hypothetical protein